MVSRAYVGPDNVNRHTDYISIEPEDYPDLRELVDDEVYPAKLISEPQYACIDVGDSKAVDISYSREGPKGEVLCHIYLFYNYDELAKVVTAYREADKDVWESDVTKIIQSVKWENPK
jgi:hypothetical protein